MNSLLCRIFPLFLLLALILPMRSTAQGKVYLVLGSDTAIWDGMDVGRYNCRYKLDLFTLPQNNAYKVMDPAFRSRFVDSFGQPVKMTWWMMAGNIFRYAVNTDVPLANTMTMYLMQKYHGESVKLLGDELSLHYHTFVWTDYNGDGKYYWNQAHGFPESRDDFDVTMAQYLLEENVYPVSYRSGWHYMDNDWQRYLDELLPYSMHNDYPNVRVTAVEPIDNVFDWSKASKEFVPYRPSPDNYQLPGNGPGWNVRSKHMGNVNQALMNDIFAKAAAGVDQVACLWAHLPEADFLANIQKIDSLAHAAANSYRTVQFRYCTGVEAMQRWLGSTDRQSPQVTLEESIEGENVSFTITASEPIFQRQPFIAVKDVYEQYSLLPAIRLGLTTWKTLLPINRARLAKVGVAVTDTVGNLTTVFKRYLPDDAFVDNKDAQYSELSGNWTNALSASWGTDARVALLANDNVAQARWTLPVSQSGRYNLFVQVPAVSNAAGSISFRIFKGGSIVDSVFFKNPLSTGSWIYLSSPMLDQGTSNVLEMVVSGNGQAGKNVAADVVRFSPLVKDRELFVPATVVDLGSVSQHDTVMTGISIVNRGTGNLTILGVDKLGTRMRSLVSFPQIVLPMKTYVLPLAYSSSDTGKFADSLSILSDDPIRPHYRVAFTASVETYFEIADNEDSLAYRETGVWSTSNAQAYGLSSRYCYVTNSQGASVVFTVSVRVSGTFDLQEIVPKTVNAAERALYVVSNGTQTIDSVYLNQNNGSGGWVVVGRYYFAAGSVVSVKVVNAGSTTSGLVLRADAIKLALVQSPTHVESSSGTDIPSRYELSQNFPNPFNPSTTISFNLPTKSFVSLKIIDALGREISDLVSEELPAGTHSKRWIAAGLPSGVYFYRLQARPIFFGQVGSFTETRKLLLLR